MGCETTDFKTIITERRDDGFDADLYTGDQQIRKNTVYSISDLLLRCKELEDTNVD